jgi:hypothetical protein
VVLFQVLGVVFRGYWFVVHQRSFVGVPSTFVSDAGGGDGVAVVFVLVGLDLCCASAAVQIR